MCQFVISLHCSKQQVVTASVVSLLYAITKHIIPSLLSERNLTLSPLSFWRRVLQNFPLTLLDSGSGLDRREAAKPSEVYT